MNWIGELCDLYEKNENLAGILKENEPVLLPLYHTTVAAQITVVIDGEGNFRRAELVDETDKQTIIPVTEKSSSRTAGKEAHPLCDNLEYLAGDYNTYVPEKDCSENHILYMEQLKGWVESPFCHKKAKAIYEYLCRNTLLRDLIAAQVLELDEDGKVSRKKKIQIVEQLKAFVRFQIATGKAATEAMLEDASGQYFEECWKDRTLQKAYIEYCRSQQKEQGLSYLSGERTAISYLHPKKIRNEGDGAKLISSNDKDYYTFRGRFINKEEAFAIGYEDSQKAHNALKWMIRKQGRNYGGMYLTIWESDLKDIPDWQMDTDTICRQTEEEDGLWQEEEEEYRGTGDAGAVRFHRAILGYQKNLDQSSRTVLMALDAATTGRLALLEFKSYQSSMYLKKIQDWYDRCEWWHEKASKERGHYSFTGMVGVKDVAELLYGTEQKGAFSLKEEQYKEVVKRWLPCVLEGQEVPRDMVRLAVRRASSPISFESRFLWERVLSLACSLVRQQLLQTYKRQNKTDWKEKWTMALDETCREREYLFGRLLAVADRIEYRTYAKDDRRQTNAKRYMNAFSQHPYRTWKVIEEKLEPYLMRLEVPERLKYMEYIDKICALFSIEDFKNDSALTGLYLLGFHNQAYAMRKKED